MPAPPRRAARPRTLAWAALLAACTPSAPAHAPTGDDAGSVRLILHDPHGAKGPSTACETELCRSLLERIHRAYESIDLAVYGVRGQPELLAALSQARARGVRVRGVVDRQADGSNIYADTDELLPLLQRGGSDLTWEQRAARRARRRTGPGSPQCPRPPGTEGPVQCLAYDLGEQCLLVAQASRKPLGGGGAIMHDKMAVFDGRWVWTGSANWSDSGVGGYNANVVVLVEHPQVAAWYTQEIEQMLRGKFHGDKAGAEDPRRVRVGTTEVEVLFSPADRPMTRGVRPLLHAARSRIDIAVFFLTHKQVVQDLIDARARGVQVRVILDATGARNGYSKHAALRAAGIPVKVEDWGGKMHMKAAAIDGATVIAGSMNWTSAGESSNDENLLVLHDPALAGQFHTFFDALWDSIDPRWAEDDPDPESRDSGTACQDGTDNDFDGLVDADDPGCTTPEPATAPPLHIVPKAGRAACDWSLAPAAP